MFVYTFYGILVIFYFFFFMFYIDILPTEFYRISPEVFVVRGYFRRRRCAFFFFFLVCFFFPLAVVIIFFFLKINLGFFFCLPLLTSMTHAAYMQLIDDCTRDYYSVVSYVAWNCPRWIVRLEIKSFPTLVTAIIGWTNSWTLIGKCR